MLAHMQLARTVHWQQDVRNRIRTVAEGNFCTVPNVVSSKNQSSALPVYCHAVGPKRQDNSLCSSSKYKFTLQYATSTTFSINIQSFFCFTDVVTCLSRIFCLDNIYRNIRVNLVFPLAKEKTSLLNTLSSTQDLLIKTLG